MAHGQSPRHVRRAKPRARASADTDDARREPRAQPAGGKNEATAKSVRGPRGARQVVESTSAGPKAAGTGGGEPVRLQRLLAGAGFGSRREVEALLDAGRVSVNGEVAKLGDRARPGRDDIRLDGERLLAERPVYWLVNKPRGVVTTVRDDAGRRTVLDLVPSRIGRVFPVGRLDVETTGLLLLTNDGDVAYALLHPSLGNEREYRVNVKGELDARAIARIEKGVHLEEGKTAPGRVRDVQFDAKAGTSTFSLTLVEGRNRQIRRSLLVLGFPVRRLVRERMGPLRLGSLAVGQGRPLTPEERGALLAHVSRLQGDAARPVRPRQRAARPSHGTARSKPASPTAKRVRGAQPRARSRNGIRT